MSISADILFLKDGPLLRALGNCSKKKTWLHEWCSPESYLPCHLPKFALVLLAAQVTCAINLQKSDLVNFWIPCGSVIRKAWAGTTSILGIHERNWHGLDTWCFQLTFSRLFQDLGLWCVWRSGKKHHSVHLLQMNTPDSAIKPYPTIWRMNMHSEVDALSKKECPKIKQSLGTKDLSVSKILKPSLRALKIMNYSILQSIHEFPLRINISIRLELPHLSF